MLHAPVGIFSRFSVLKGCTSKFTEIHPPLVSIFSPCVEVAFVALFSTKLVSPQSEFPNSCYCNSRLTAFIKKEKREKAFLGQPVLRRTLTAQLRHMHIFSLDSIRYQTGTRAVVPGLHRYWDGKPTGTSGRPVLPPATSFHPELGRCPLLPPA
jgi:hypothetical protein